MLSLPAMRSALFALLAAPAVLAGHYLSFRSGVYDARGAGFPLSLILATVAAAALAGWGLEIATARAAATRRSAASLAIEFAAVLASLLGPAMLHRHEMPLAFGLFALLGLRLLDNHQADRWAASVAIGLDFAVEALLVHQGAYGYSHAMVSPLPVWLPAVWANLGVACWRLYPALKRFGASSEPPASAQPSA